MIHYEPGRSGRHGDRENVGVEYVIEPDRVSRSGVVDDQVVDLRRVVRVREVIEAKTDGGLPSVGVDEQRALEVEIEASPGIIRHATAAFDRQRAPTAGGCINDRALPGDLKPGRSPRGIIADELPIQP